MKTLLELQALQNLNTSDNSSPNTLSSSNSTLFSELLGDLLNDQGLPSSSLNGLGDMNSLQQLMSSLQGDSSASPVNASNYISSFLLNNSAQMASIANLVNQT